MLVCCCSPQEDPEAKAQHARPISPLANQELAEEVLHAAVFAPETLPCEAQATKLEFAAHTPSDPVDAPEKLGPLAELTVTMPQESPAAAQCTGGATVPQESAATAQSTESVTMPKESAATAQCKGSTGIHVSLKRRLKSFRDTEINSFAALRTSKPITSVFHKMWFQVFWTFFFPLQNLSQFALCAYLLYASDEWEDDPSWLNPYKHADIWGLLVHEKAEYTRITLVIGCVFYCLIAIIPLCMVGIARTGRTDRAIIVLTCWFAVTIAGNVAFGVIRFLSLGWQMAITYWVFCVILAYCVYVFLMNERAILLAFCSLASWALLSIVFSVIAATPEAFVFRLIQAYYFVLFAGCAAVARWRAWIALRDAADLLVEDTKQYDAAWQEILTTCGTDVDALSELVVQHLTIKSTDLTVGTNPRFSHVQQSDDLDQIFADARVVNGPYQEWVGSLAAQCGGRHLPVNIKSEERALQKVRRSYADDASRLCDVTRSSISFKALADVRCCLKLIFQDCTVLRVKNRFHRNYNATLGGGYRDVSLNIQWDLPDGRCHVCELQLQLDVMFALKSGGGHKRYVAWRDLRGD